MAGFGFSIGDILAVGDIAWKVYKSCKHAGKHFKIIAQDVGMLKNALDEFKDETTNPISPIHRANQTQRAQFKNVLKSCKNDLQELEKILVRYNSLGTNDPKMRDRLGFTDTRKTEMQNKLKADADRINFVLTQIHNSALGRIESNTEEHTKVLSQIQAKLNVMHEDVVAGRKDPSKDPSVLISMDEWGSLEKELVDDSITEADVEMNKDNIKEWLAQVHIGDELDKIPEIDKDDSETSEEDRVLETTTYSIPKSNEALVDSNPKKYQATVEDVDESLTIKAESDDGIDGDETKQPDISKSSYQSRTGTSFDKLGQSGHRSGYHGKHPSDDINGYASESSEETHVRTKPKVRKVRSDSSLSSVPLNHITFQNLSQNPEENPKSSQYQPGMKGSPEHPNGNINWYPKTMQQNIRAIRRRKRESRRGARDGFAQIVTEGPGASITRPSATLCTDDDSGDSREKDTRFNNTLPNATGVEYEYKDRGPARSSQFPSLQHQYEDDISKKNRQSTRDTDFDAKRPYFKSYQYSDNANRRSRSFEFTDPESVFADLFRKSNATTSDIEWALIEEPKDFEIVEKPLPVSLEDIFNGVTKKMKVGRERREPSTGRIFFEDVILDVPIKPGVKEGTKIKFKSVGDQVGEIHEDLHFIIEMKPHPLFQRDGPHLKHTAKITLKESLIGWKRSLLTIGNQAIHIGKDGVTVPGWTQTFPGLGLPNSKVRGERGDLIVGVEIMFPDRLSMRQILSIQSIL